MHIPTNLVEATIKLRRHIHQHPELGANVPQTAALVHQKLEGLGLEIRRHVGGHGLTADLIIPNATKTLGFRADMDALPIQEMRDTPYKSTIDGRAHMCGHDAHTAMLIGAAKLLVQQKDQLQHNIRFIFQPNEENIPGGAVPMIEDAVLEGVDEIYAQHVWPTLDTHYIGICSGPAMGQPDILDITITGRGGHAAYPQHTIDPVVIASQYISSVQSIIARNTPALDAAVVSFTMVHAGEAHNIIPETIQLKASIRTLSPNIKQQIKTRLYQLLDGIC